MFAHKVLFTLQEHLKTTKTNKTSFFFGKERMNLLPHQQLFIIVSFDSTKSMRKELCVDNKVQETTGVVYCPLCGIEKCVYILTNRTSRL